MSMRGLLTLTKKFDFWLNAKGSGVTARKVDFDDLGRSSEPEDPIFRGQQDSCAQVLACADTGSPDGGRSKLPAAAKC